MIIILVVGILLLVSGFQRRRTFKRSRMQTLDEQMRTGTTDPTMTIAAMHGQTSGKGDGTLLIIFGGLALCLLVLAVLVEFGGDSGSGSQLPAVDSSQR